MSAAIVAILMLTATAVYKNVNKISATISRGEAFFDFDGQVESLFDGLWLRHLKQGLPICEVGGLKNVSDLLASSENVVKIIPTFQIPKRFGSSLASRCRETKKAPTSILKLCAQLLPGNVLDKDHPFLSSAEGVYLEARFDFYDPMKDRDVSCKNSQGTKALLVKGVYTIFWKNKGDQKIGRKYTKVHHKFVSIDQK